MKILVVEDNAMNLKLFQILISAMGHECLTAADGGAAVITAREQQPDLVLMDIQMPVMDGITALHRLREEPETREIPVAALTSYAMGEERQQLLKEGFISYISKPIRREIFVDTLELILAQIARRPH